MTDPGWRDSVIEKIGNRAQTWRHCALAMLAIPVCEYGPQIDPYAAAGVALRAARKELLPRERMVKAVRKGRVPQFEPVAEVHHDRPADHQYQIRERDIQDSIIRECEVALVWMFSHLADDTVDDAIDTLMPLVTRKVRKGFLPAASAPSHQRVLVTDTVDRVSQRVLTELGTVSGTKTKPGMHQGNGIPTSGRASKPIVWADPGRGRSWVDEGDHYREVGLHTAALTLATPDQAPHRAPSTRAEQADDRIADFKRPVKKESTRKNKRSGRMGGSAIIR